MMIESHRALAGSGKTRHHGPPPYIFLEGPLARWACRARSRWTSLSLYVKIPNLGPLRSIIQVLLATVTRQKNAASEAHALDVQVRRQGSVAHCQLPW